MYDRGLVVLDCPSASLVIHIFCVTFSLQVLKSERPDVDAKRSDLLKLQGNLAVLLSTRVFSFLVFFVYFFQSHLCSSSSCRRVPPSTSSAREGASSSSQRSPWKDSGQRHVSWCFSLLSTLSSQRRIRHNSHEIATNPVILWIELGGKPKWLPLNFGYRAHRPRWLLFQFWVFVASSNLSFSPSFSLTVPFTV